MKSYRIKQETIIIGIPSLDKVQMVAENYLNLFEVTFKQNPKRENIFYILSRGKKTGYKAEYSLGYYEIIQEIEQPEKSND